MKELQNLDLEAKLALLQLPLMAKNKRLIINRPLAQLRVRRFLGLFWPIFDSACGGNILLLILPPQAESKIGSKEPENRQNLNFERGLIPRFPLKTQAVGLSQPLLEGRTPKGVLY
jgi:hypothetical protein